jgi:prefoldin subunit 5
MFFDIDTDAVIAELDKVDQHIDQLRTILENIESNISKGWDSERANGLVTPKIEEIKSSINKMQESTTNVRSNVVQYVANVKNADSSGNITSANA